MGQGACSLGGHLACGGTGGTYLKPHNSDTVLDTDNKETSKSESYR